MFPISAHLPPTNLGDIQVFQAVTGVGATALQLWQKPKGASTVFMFVVGSGGGGGAGFTRASGNGAGGGSGACSGLVRFYCDAYLLPDILYVQVGPGGAGGVAGVSNGGAGINTFISVSKNVTAPNVILASGGANPGGGGTNGTISVGSAGSTPNIAAIQAFNNLGVWAAIVGIIGATGGTPGVAGTSITAWAGIPLSPGAGGGGVSAGTNPSGGAQTATAILDLGAAGYIPTTTGFLAAAGVNGGYIHGQQGFSMFEPFYQTGGSGGAGQDGAVGGAGGKGGVGCGGGGGGSGTTGGKGGPGGDGLALIISW